MISKRDIERFTGRIDKVREALPVADPMKFLRDALDVYKESRRIDLEIVKIESQTQVALARVTAKHALYREAFEMIFEERRDVIGKHFDVIEKGIAANDRALILGGLQGLGQVVASSPFANISELATVLEGDRPLEI